MTKDVNMRKNYVKYLVGYIKRKELNRHHEKEKETEQNLGVYFGLFLPIKREATWYLSAIFDTYGRVV